MSVGLIALLDDVAGIAKVAAASVDDIASQAAKAGAKAAGVVIDDAAVTPRYLVGFSAARELPIVGRIALGSLKNKLLYLLPASLVLSLVAPWIITPLLMLGGAYLCYEGAEKVYELLVPHDAHGPEKTTGTAAQDPAGLESAKIRSAIQTDFILSAEIMAITLATMPETGFVMQAVVLAVVGTLLTGVVYGGVALIVKADDAGLAMAAAERPAALRGLIRAVGRGLVKGMPYFLKVLAGVGTAAMIWVGGGILLHGAEELGLPGPQHLADAASAGAAAAVPAMAGFASWVATAAVSGVVGLVIGGLLIPVVSKVIAPFMHWVGQLRR